MHGRNKNLGLADGWGLAQSLSFRVSFRECENQSPSLDGDLDCVVASYVASPLAEFERGADSLKLFLGSTQDDLSASPHTEMSAGRHRQAAQLRVYV